MRRQKWVGRREHEGKENGRLPNVNSNNKLTHLVLILCRRDVYSVCMCDAWEKEKEKEKKEEEDEEEEEGDEPEEEGGEEEEKEKDKEEEEKTKESERARVCVCVQERRTMVFTIAHPRCSRSNGAPRGLCPAPQRRQ